MERIKKPLLTSTLPGLTRPSQLLAAGLPFPEQPALFETAHAPLCFAIKRHRATNLHTDYRLEVGETLFSLVSWGHPSFDPARPVALREMSDHDPAYMLSERRIPDGKYGAGPMVVWDFGTYLPTPPFDGSPSQAVLESLLAGGLELQFEGRRMRGAFRLEIADRGWRLAKLADEFATAERIEWDDRSIVTGRSLDDLERVYRASLRGEAG